MEFGSLHFHIKWSYLRIKMSHFGKRFLWHYTIDTWGLCVTVVSVTLIMHIQCFITNTTASYIFISCDKAGSKYYFYYPPPFANWVN